MLFNKILFPVDLSDQCRRAAPFVRAAALRFHSEVLMLHVMEMPRIYGSPEFSFTPAVDVEQWRKERRATVDSFLIDELAGVSVVRKMAEGNAALEIVKSVRSERMELVMMPTHGHGPFRALLLGSVTAKVLHDVECPVWTASHTENTIAHPPERWRRILCAAELTDEDVRTVSWAHQLATEQGAEFLLLHAIPPFNFEAMWPEESFRQSVNSAARKQMTTLFGSIVAEGQIAIQFGSPVRVVRKVATEWDADLVVIGRGEAQKPFGRLRSDAYGIIRESPCPVVSV